VKSSRAGCDWGKKTSVRRRLAYSARMRRCALAAATIAVGAALAVPACGSRPPASPPRPTPSSTLWPPIDEAFLAAYTETSKFTLGEPKLLGITRDGTVLFRRTPPRARVADLYAFDSRTGEERVLATADALLAGQREQLSDAEKARRERTRTSTRGVVDADVSRDGKTVLVPLGERVFLVEVATGAARELELGDGYPYDPRLSPAGDAVAFARGGELWIAPTGGTGAPRALTKGGGGAIDHGVAEFVAQEELRRTRGYWWSPDGATMLYQRTDATAVDTLYVSDPRHPERAPVPFRYPRPGTANADVRLELVSTRAPARGKPAPAPVPVSWDRARWPYLAKVVWDDDGPPTLVVLDRDQYEIAVLALDPATGETTVLLTERDDAWINVPDGAPHWLGADKGFLWMTEQPGAWVVQHRGRDGGLIAQLTAPGLGVRAIDGVDGDKLWLTAQPGPTQDHIYTVPLAGGAPKVVESGGVHAATSDHGVTVIHRRDKAGTPSWKVLTAAGEHSLRAVVEDPPYLPTTELEEVEVDGVALPVAITRPRAFDPAIRYPVLVKVYGGPHGRSVIDTRRAYLLDQFYADAGFIVVRIDNRGTFDLVRAQERAVVKDLATVAVADQVAALRALGSRHRELDLDRVGVYGWSFGGYMAAMMVLQHPELYKAAIAGAPVTDWALYDTAYTERYMKQPKDNPDGYAKANVLTYADKLARPLLVIHGITDDNVHFAHTLALIEALYLAGKRAEIVTLSATHMVPDPKLALAQERIQLDFFRAHLAAPAP
jgi:dipeptidyl-peptidase 4